MDLIQLESKIQDTKNLNQLKESKNPNKIQEINYSKDSNQESNNSNELKDLRLDTNLKSTFKESNLDFNLQKDSKIQDTKNLNRLKESKNPNKIQMKSSKTTLSKISISIIASILLSQSLAALPSGGKFVGGSSGSIKVNGKEMNITGVNL